jgi:hypothetical protein
MNLKFNAEQFDKYQAMLAAEIAQRVRIKLQEAGIAGKQLEECTASITFSIATVIDDLAAVEFEGMEVRPYLTFRTGDDEIIHCGENSCVNTFVHDVLKKIFS